MKLIDRELSQLIKDYDRRIEDLEKEISLLSNKITTLDKENEKLKFHITNANSKAHHPREYYNLLSQYIERLSGGISYEAIDEWFLSGTLEDAVILLTAAEKLYIDKNYEMLSYILDLISHNQDIIAHKDDEIKQRFFSLVKKILIEDEAEADIQYDLIIKKMYDVLIGLHKTNLHNEILEFLKEFHERMFDLVLLLNEPIVIIKYLRLLFLFGLTNSVVTALNHILDIEWGFLDSSLHKNDFVFLLWYCYLFDLDDRLIDQAVNSLQWFNEKYTDISLYFYIMEDSEDKNVALKREIKQFQRSSTFVDIEKAAIINKVKSKVRSILNKALLVLNLNTEIYSVDRTLIPHLSEKYELKKQLCALPLFFNKSDQETERYVRAELYVNNNKKHVFIENDKLNILLKDNKPLLARTKRFQVDSLDNPSNIKKDTFTWPSTEIEDTKTASDIEDKVLKEKSELKMMGYQISGLTRVRRWEILEKALPKLGLKKIAYTIAYNVKLRKGQKNGINKFHHAITEWEHDLSQLKKHYYKKDFNWPNT